MNRLSHLALTSREIISRVALALFITSLLFGYPGQVSSALAQSTGIARTITVIGEGRVTLQPDIARADIGVEVSGATVAKASAENKQIIESVLATLKEYGIIDKDIQTLNFNIYAERYGYEGILEESEIQYRVNNMVSVIIRDLDSVGDVLDAAIEAGANSIHGLNFQIEDPSSVESDARQGAVEDARAKAEELASLTGVAVGDVVSISEVIGGNGGFYQGNNFSADSNAYGGGGDGFAPGELSLTMNLQMTYEIVSSDIVSSDHDMASSSEDLKSDIEGDTESDTESNTESGATDEPMAMFVASETKPCVGVVPQDCLQIKFDAGGEWEFFYDQIEGFEYEQGFDYELLVTRSEVENPPADASSIKYTLVEVVAKNDVSSEAEDSALDGTNWILAGIMDGDLVTTSDIDETIMATFGEGRMSGSAGCNTYSVGYTAGKNSLALGPAAVTRMACPTEQMEREGAFLKALGMITDFAINDDGILELNDVEGNVQIIFSPK